MNITTLVTDYLAANNDIAPVIGKSFIVRSQSGYYFPCFSAFVTFANGGSSSYLNFIKKYNGEACSCTRVDILTEEPNCEILGHYRYPTTPYDSQA